MKQRILDSIRIDGVTGCWVWIRSKTKKGYGLMTMPGPKGKQPKRLAHRVAYEVFRGAIPSGYDIDHQCNNPSCVNPQHLEAKTRRENLLRSSYTGGKARQTACIWGHPFDEWNTYIQRGPETRKCETCRRRRQLWNIIPFEAPYVPPGWVDRARVFERHAVDLLRILAGGMRQSLQVVDDAGIAGEEAAEVLDWLVGCDLVGRKGRGRFMLTPAGREAVRDPEAGSP